MQPACVTEYTPYVLHHYFLWKWQNNSSSRIASNFATSLATAKWKPFGRFIGLSVMMPFLLHKLRSGTTDSKTAAQRWRAMLVPGRPSTSRNDKFIDQVWTLVMQALCVTIQEFAEEVGISTGSVHSILTNDLAMQRVSAKLMLKLLTTHQKQLHLEVSQDLLDYANSVPEFLNIVTTGDESWVYGYDPETKAQSPQRKHSTFPRGQKRPGKCGVTSKWCWPFSLTLVGWCNTSTHHKAKTLKRILPGSLLLPSWCCVVEETGHDSCNVTMHQLIPHNWFKLSSPNATFLWFNRLPTLPTWLLAICSCSPTRKRSWKGLDLSHETTLYWTRKPSCIPFAKRHSRNVSNNGGTTGRSVFSHKETTSKGIRVADLHVCKCIFSEPKVG